MKKSHNAIFTVLAVVLLLGVGVWYYFYWQNSTYFTTDNAKVSAQLYTLTSQSSGKLVKYSVALGKPVKKDQVIAMVENGPYIKSPIDGTIVVKSDLILDQEVSPADTLAVIADTANIYVKVNIEETDIGKIHLAQEVVVLLDAYPGQKFQGHVSEIDQITQSALNGGAMSMTTSGTYTKVTQFIPIKVTVEGANMNGLIGTNATVKIKVK